MGYWQTIQQSGRPLFLPDIGTYFNQDITQAKTLIDELVAAGVTTIKGEILNNANICLQANLSGNERYWGQSSNTFKEENYRQLIERKVVSLEAYETLFSYAQSQGVDVVVSVYDFVGADFAKKIGVKAIKIASSNITHQPLIEYISALDIPMIIDTGHASMEEIARAHQWAMDASNQSVDLLIEHSPKGPPAPVSEQNLRFMQTLGSAFNVYYGLSDHHAGDEMLLAATAMGAIVLEKGVCANQMGDEQDGGHAIKISEVQQVLEKIKLIADAMGSGQRHLPRERAKYISRMGMAAKTDLNAGDGLTLETVHFAFPALGIEAEHWSQVANCRLKHGLKAGQVIDWADILFKGE